jgi:hypothetical protein
MPDQMGRVFKRGALGVVTVLLLACAMRAPHTVVADPSRALSERDVHRLIGVWQSQLGRYLAVEGAGDPAALSRMQVLRSRDVLRPARITFGALDVEATVPGRDGWDIQGVLLGKQAHGARSWYVFIVAVVARSGYRPSSIQDLRLVGLSAQGGNLAWTMGSPDLQALQRYRDTFRETPVRFPADIDRFSMSATADRVFIREMQSAAEWSLALGS